MRSQVLEVQEVANQVLVNQLLRRVGATPRPGDSIVADCIRESQQLYLFEYQADIVCSWGRANGRRIKVHSADIQKVSRWFQREVSPPLILVVDDEVVISETFAIILQQSGFRADARYDGDQAVEYCRQYRPDLVVMGIIMPKMNGFEAAIQILKFQPTCKFVFMSGCVPVNETPDQPDKFGLPFPFLPKPTHPPEFIQTMRAVLEGRYRPMNIDGVERIETAYPIPLDIKTKFAVH